MSSSSEDSDGLPQVPSDLSRGSSVSTELQEEYEDLLKYAIVTSKWEPAQAARDDIPQLRLNDPDGLTTVDEYMADTESTNDNGDSAMGTDEAETNRTNQGSFAPKPIPSPGRTPFRVPMLSPSESSDVPTTPISVSAYLRSTKKMDKENLVAVDADMYTMANNLDQWSVKLKTMVLGEMSKIKACINERQEYSKHEQQTEHEKKVTNLKEEIDHLKMLLQTYEVSVERKDQVISNLTRGVQTGRNRIDMAKAFMHWKVRMLDEKRQNFTSHLARKHRQRVLEMKAWQRWRSTIEARWKERVEKACQNKAQEICEKLSDDYENKIAKLNEELENAHQEISRLQKDRDAYQGSMKKAFMRGVCALNLEAMSMFNEGEAAGIPDAQTVAAAVDALNVQAHETGHVQSSMSQRQMPNRDPLPGQVLRHENATTGEHHAPERLQPTKLAINQSQTLVHKQCTRKNVSRKPRTQSPAERFGPPPSGILVERHLPNVQNQTTERALSHASKYPNAPTQPIAGQKHFPHPIKLVQ